MTISDDGSLERNRMFSGLSKFIDQTEISQGRGERTSDILEIPMDDVVFVQILHARQYGSEEN